MEVWHTCLFHGFMCGWLQSPNRSHTRRRLTQCLYVFLLLYVSIQVFFTHKETNGWQKRWTLWHAIWQDAALSNVRTFLVAKCAGLITWWLSRWKIKLLPSSREFLRGFAVTESGHVPPVSRTGFSVTSLPLSFRTLNNTKMYVAIDWSLTYWLQRAFQHGRPIVCASPPLQRGHAVSSKAVCWSASVNKSFCLTNGFVPSVLNSSYCGRCSPRKHSKCRNVGFLHTRRWSWVGINRRTYRLVHIQDLHVSIRPSASTHALL